MEIYFSPEVITPHFQILNVVCSKENALGNVAILFDEKRLYVYGILEEKEVEVDFKDLITPYIKGLAKAKPDLDVYSCLYTGCDKVELNEEAEDK